MNTVSRMWEVVNEGEINESDLKTVVTSLSEWYTLLDKKQDEIVIELQGVLENFV